jgi:hypothetical protein
MPTVDRHPDVRLTDARAAVKEQIRHLRELIAALDRRVPRIESAGEIGIAHDAAALKQRAVDRLAELERSGS